MVSYLMLINQSVVSLLSLERIFFLLFLLPFCFVLLYNYWHFAKLLLTYKLRTSTNYTHKSWWKLLKKIKCTIRYIVISRSFLSSQLSTTHFKCGFIHHSFNKHLLTPYYVSGTLLNVTDKVWIRELDLSDPGLDIMASFVCFSFCLWASIFSGW